MASDIYGIALIHFPHLPARYVVGLHGTNRAGEPGVLYPCTLHSTFVTDQHSEYRKTTATCPNSRGDSFQYVFMMS
jgi:hypothetical protein